MSLMFPPAVHRASAVAPRTIARRFRLQVRCSECSRVALTGIEMIDQPDERATEDDFHATGAIDRIDWSCERCGSDRFTVLQTIYLRQPTDV